MAINITNLETVLSDKIAAATTSATDKDLLLISKSVEALDNAIGLKSADIGVTVQGYDATILNDADIGVNVQAYDATIVKTGNANTFTAEQTFGEIKETVYTLSGTVIDPANGGIQSINLGAPTNFTELLESGQTVVLMITNGLTNPIGFPAITWVTSAGNVAPTLTDSSVVVIWKIGTTLHGAFVGSYV